MSRLAYLGTPDLAVPPLRALVAAGHEVALVVTRPDRRRGRGAATSPSPVKAEAQLLGLPVSTQVQDVAGAGVELGVVVAYGRIIPGPVLEAVPMVNVHFSLLPRWRGAAPVERAILAGDRVTGVCLMGVDEGLDTGPVYACREVTIETDEDLASLRGRLVEAACDMLVDLLARPLPDPVPQRGEPTYAEKIGPGDLELRWERPSDGLARTVRLGRAWTTWRGRRLRVLGAEPVGPPPGRPRPPGSMVGDAVVTGDGALRLVEVQPEGRGPMTAAEWLRGARPLGDERLGADAAGNPGPGPHTRRGAR